MIHWARSSADVNRCSFHWVWVIYTHRGLGPDSCHWLALKVLSSCVAGGASLTVESLGGIGLCCVTGASLLFPSSVYWDYAMTIRLEEIVYLHCHQQGKGGGHCFISRAACAICSQRAAAGTWRLGRWQRAPRTSLEIPSFCGTTGSNPSLLDSPLHAPKVEELSSVRLLLCGSSGGTVIAGPAGCAWTVKTLALGEGRGPGLEPLVLG